MHSLFNKVNKLKTSVVLPEEWVQVMKSCLEKGNDYRKKRKYAGDSSVDQAKEVINIHDKTIEITCVLPSKNCFGNDIYATITGFLKTPASLISREVKQYVLCLEKTNPSL